MRWRAVFALLIALLLSSGAALAAVGPTPGADAMNAATRILDAAKAEAQRDCSRPTDQLVQILCRGRLRVGLRTFYPGFSVRNDKSEFVGFEVDIAQRIADFLGVTLVTVAVDPKSRIPMVASGDIDLTIATMGHNALRDDQVRFIRPHYYESRTAVVGANSSPVKNWDDLSGNTVCLPVGSSSNILFMRHHVPVLTFDRPEQLLDALNFNECAFIVQDDTFFASLLADPKWSSRFGIKFGFAPIPWGMAVARTGTAQLAALLDELSAAYHANHVFLDLARRNQLDLAFLNGEATKFASDHCIADDGKIARDCLLPPADTSDASATTVVTGEPSWLEQSLYNWFGISLPLSLLRDPSMRQLLLEGIGYSLTLIIGSQVSTMIFALLIGRLMSTGPVFTRRITGLVSSIGQTTPLPLLLFFGYIIAGGLLHYTGTVALCVAILVIGIYNGCNAGRAINEAHESILRRNPRANAVGTAPTFRRAVGLAGIQLIAFLINAAKGSPGAGMIGVPEFLNVLTDLTSYSRDRFAVYLVLLVFYTGAVLLVILTLYGTRKRLLQRDRAA